MHLLEIIKFQFRKKKKKKKKKERHTIKVQFRKENAHIALYFTAFRIIVT